MAAIDDLENAVLTLEQTVQNKDIEINALREQLAAATTVNPQLQSLTTRVNAATLAVQNI